MKTLHLNLKGEHFDRIKRGEKAEEYRLCNDYWSKRLLHKHSGLPIEYDIILVKKGYPKAGDQDRILERIWRGVEIKTIIHPHFGPRPVKVFAIRVNP